jgi:hypothetical protein
MNDRRALIILLALFVILVALVALTGQQPAQTVIIESTTTSTAEALPEGSLLRVFPDLAVLDIQAVRLEDLSENRELTLARDSQGSWTAPELEGEGELDTDAASSIARTLVLLPYARSINILPDTDFAVYGLSPTPQMLLQILLVDGSSHVVAIGDLSTTNHTYYALVDERDEIFQIEMGPVDFLKNLIFQPPIRLTN